MRRGSGSESKLSPEQLNPDNWPDVEISHLSRVNQRKFNQRKRAIELYLKSDDLIKVIIKKGWFITL
jgi:hypothetical protein